MSTPSEPSSSEPIDAEFTEASTPGSKSESSGKGVGWTGVISASALAALAGGAIGVVASGTDGKYAQASEVAVDISKLEEGSRDLKSEIDLIRDDIREAQALIDRQSESVTALETTYEAVGPELKDQVDELRERYKALIGDTNPFGVPSLTEVTENSEDVSVEDLVDLNTLPKPNVSLQTLAAQISALSGLSAEEGVPASAEDLQLLSDRLTELEAAKAAQLEAETAQQTRIEDILTRLTSLETNLEDVSNSPGVDLANLPELSESLSDIDALKTDIEALKTLVNDRFAEVADAETLSSLEDRETRARAMLSLSTIERAANRGEAFGDAYETLVNVMPANTDLAALRSISQTSVPTFTVLQNEFETLRPQAIASSRKASNSATGGWLETALAALVTVREAEGPDGGSARTMLERAATELERGNLNEALDIVSRMNGPAADTFNEWKQHAQARIDLEAHLKGLRQAVLEIR